MDHTAREDDEHGWPCTRGEGDGVCAMFSDLDSVNAIFSQFELELQEREPDLLSLVQTFVARQPRRFETPQPSAWCLLDRVLQGHRCIVAVDLDCACFAMPDHHLNASVIRKARSLVSLRLRALLLSEEEWSMLGFALCSSGLLEDICLEQTICLGGVFVLLLTSFLQNTTALRSFSLADSHIDRAFATGLMTGLANNATIRTLTLSLCVCYKGEGEHGAAMAACVSGISTLTTLTLDRCCLQCIPSLRRVMVALIANTHVSELTLRGFYGSTAFNELMPRILDRNETLMRLSLTSSASVTEACECRGRLGDCDSCPTELIEPDAADIEPVTAGILRNRKLEELTIDLSKSTFEERKVFFLALAWNTALRRVVIQRYRNEDILSICQSVRDAGVSDRVFINSDLSMTRPWWTVAEFTEISGVCVTARCSGDSQLLQGVLSFLPSWRHVTRLTVNMSAKLFVDANALLGSYIERSLSLRKFVLTIDERICNSRSRKSFIEALFRNRSIRKVVINAGLLVSPCEASVMATALCANRTLCDLALFTDSLDWRPIAAMERQLRPGLVENHTLCSFEYTVVKYSSDFHAVQSVVRRNLALATCAAHFVVLGDRSKRCLDALRQAWHSPGLLYKVMQMASVDENEAAVRIQNCVFENGM